MIRRNNATVARGKGMKLKERRYNTIARKLYFFIRVVGHWNRLPFQWVARKQWIVSSHDWINISEKNRLLLNSVLKASLKFYKFPTTDTYLVNKMCSDNT